MIPGNCARPPRGWYCLRGEHDGPCAAWPTRWTRIKLWWHGYTLPKAPKRPEAPLHLGLVKVTKGG